MYNHADENYICPFCLLVKGIKNEYVYSVRSDVVYWDKKVTAFVSSHQWPNNPGNVIVIPNLHYENIYDLPLHYAIDIQKIAKIIALTMKVVFNCAGITVRQNNEPAGNQDVWHYHLHVTPRYEGDFFYTTERKLMPVGEREKYAEKIRHSLPEN